MFKTSGRASFLIIRFFLYGGGGGGFGGGVQVTSLCEGQRTTGRKAYDTEIPLLTFEIPPGTFSFRDQCAHH